jgi:hypothetical protein
MNTGLEPNAWQAFFGAAAAVGAVGAQALPRTVPSLGL